MVFVFPKNANISNWNSFLVEFPAYTPSMYTLEFIHSSTLYLFGLFVNPKQDEQIAFMQGFKNIETFENVDTAKLVYPEISNEKAPN